LDTVNPSVNSISISPSVGAAGTVFNLTVNISDDISVLNATASIQKPDENQTALIILSLSSGLYNGSWNSSGSGDGSYVVDITAYDSSGNSVEKENGAVIPLSTNAVNVSVNSSINLTSEVPVIINATAQTDTWINITSNADSNASVAVAKYSDNIESVENTEGTELGKYLSIIVDNVTNRNISSAVIKVYYTDAEIAAKNLQESTLRLYKFNATSEIWVLTGNSGVDTANNFAYGNVTSFSSFGIFGTLISAASSASSSSAGASKAGGVCTPKWDCTGWGECLPEGKMTRSCTRVGTCFMGDRPEEEKRCEYIQEKQIPELNQEAKSPDIKEIEKEQFAPPNLLPFRIIYIPLIAFTVIIISNWARRRKGK
ncbi:hypothetical protein HYU14_06835, partial [Candidatus Woesearchaeota archaeon]|nr:hypothetical protein [Candidatus Woesearchaeota archaeon]